VRLEWDDYSWDEVREIGRFSLDRGDEEDLEDLEEVYSEFQPLTVVANREKYFADLVFWLRAEQRGFPLREGR